MSPAHNCQYNPPPLPICTPLPLKTRPNPPLTLPLLLLLLVACMDTDSGATGLWEVECFVWGQWP